MAEKVVYWNGSFAPQGEAALVFTAGDGIYRERRTLGYKLFRSRKYTA